MASIFQPSIQTFKAGGTIVKGHVVKLSTDDGQTVIEATAATDKSCGIAQCDAVSGGLVEVALSGGGAKAKAHTTIAIGDFLASYTDGTLNPTTSANDVILGQAMQAAVVGDIFAMHVIVSLL